jgi:hypothetical protein
LTHKHHHHHHHHGDLLHEDIANAAYYIWLRESRLPGYVPEEGARSEKSNWYAAERQLERFAPDLSSIADFADTQLKSRP